MTLAQVQKAIEDRLAIAVEIAVDEIADGYREKVGAKFWPPSSNEGEYPAVRTGQGRDSIFSAVNPNNKLEGRAGMPGPDQGIQRPPHKTRGGTHLEWLAELQNRLGIYDSFFEDLDQIRAQIVEDLTA
jgi:hypothetical protein